MTEKRGSKILSIIFFILAGLSAIGWVLFYGYVSAMACAFGSPNGNCRTRMPWELQGEDFTFLVVTPGLIFLVFLGLGLLTRPR